MQENYPLVTSSNISPSYEPQSVVAGVVFVVYAAAVWSAAVAVNYAGAVNLAAVVNVGAWVYVAS